MSKPDPAALERRVIKLEQHQDPTRIARLVREQIAKMARCPTAHDAA